MLFGPETGYDVQAPEFKSWRGARKHPRYDSMIFAELSNGGIVQQIRLDPAPEIVAMPGMPIDPTVSPADPDLGSPGTDVAPGTVITEPNGHADDPGPEGEQGVDGIPDPQAASAPEADLDEEFSVPKRRKR